MPHQLPALLYETLSYADQSDSRVNSYDHTLYDSE